MLNLTNYIHIQHTLLCCGCLSPFHIADSFAHLQPEPVPLREETQKEVSLWQAWPYKRGCLSPPVSLALLPLVPLLPVASHSFPFSLHVAMAALTSTFLPLSAFLQLAIRPRVNNKKTFLAFYLLVYECFALQACLVPVEGVRSPGTGVLMASYKLLYGCWELNPGSLPQPAEKALVLTDLGFCPQPPSYEEPLIVGPLCPEGCNPSLLCLES